MSENNNEFVDLTSAAPVPEETVSNVVETVSEAVTAAPEAVQEVKQEIKADSAAVAAAAKAEAKEAQKRAKAAEKQAEKEARKQAKNDAKKEAKKQKKLDKIAKEQEKIDLCPKEYRPVSTAKYFWYMVLCGLPVLGLIFTLIFSIAPRNKNIKRFGRAILAFYIIGIVLVLLSMVISMFVFGESFAEIIEAIGTFIEEILYAFNFG